MVCNRVYTLHMHMHMYMYTLHMCNMVQGQQGVQQGVHLAHAHAHAHAHVHPAHVQGGVGVQGVQG